MAQPSIDDPYWTEPRTDRAAIEFGSSEEDESEAESEAAAPKIIWMTPEEYDVKELPILFSGSSRRPKGPNSLYPLLRNTVVRSQEHPGGVYVDQDGALKPDDPRSNVYRLMDEQMLKESKKELAEYKRQAGQGLLTGSRFDNDLQPEIAEEEKKTRRKRRRISPEEDEWAPNDDDETVEMSDGSWSPDGPGSDEDADEVEELKVGVRLQQIVCQRNLEERRKTVAAGRQARRIAKWAAAFRKKQKPVKVRAEPDIVLAQGNPSCELFFWKGKDAAKTVGGSLDLDTFLPICQCGFGPASDSDMKAHLLKNHF